MKICTGCGERKPFTAFHKAKLGRNGLTPRCKTCRKLQARERYLAKASEICKKTRAYYQQHETTIRIKMRRRYKVAPEKHLDRLRKRRQAEPEKYAARRAVQSALRNGTLKKPAACQRCRRTDAPRLVAHHHSYEPGRELDVEFICDRCHMRGHASHGRAA